MASRRRLIAKPDPLVFPDHQYEDVMALKAVYQGRATENQQIRAINWIIKKAANIAGNGYDPDRDTAIIFNDGRRFVGQVLVDLIAEPVAQVKARFPETPLRDLPDIAENPADFVPTLNEGDEDDG